MLSQLTSYIENNSGNPSFQLQILNEFYIHKIPVPKKFEMDQFVGKTSNSDLIAIQCDTRMCFDFISELTRSMIRTHRPLAVWYYSIDGVISQPVSFNQLCKKLLEGHINQKNYFWNEYLDGWHTFESFPNLFSLNNFQTYTETQQQQLFAQKHTLPFDKRILMLIVGIVQATLVFIWMTVAIVQCFEKHISIGEAIFGFIFCFLQFGLSIPTAIGLIMNRRWGAQFKIVISVVAILWIISRIFLQVDTLLWLLFLIFEAATLTIVVLNYRNYSIK